MKRHINVKKKLISSLLGSCDLSSKFDLPTNAVLEISTKARICGRKYSKGNIVILRKRLRNRVLDFAEIVSIVGCEAVAYLLVEELDTVGFDSYMNCYRVKKNRQFCFWCIFSFRPVGLPST